jgi:molybdopterin converting factor small subunit
LSDDHPFGKMVELGQLVLKVKQIKDTMRQEKVSKATEKLEKDLSLIRNEAEQAKARISDSIKIEQLETTLSELENKYNDLLNSINEARNLDQYMTSSANNLDGFRRLIQSLVAKNDPDKKTKHIRLSSLVPIANKKITNQKDINKVVSDIKERLEEELKDADEISID